jgi:ABC-type multidrug transport system fused ATPase/permease subunit
MKILSIKSRFYSYRYLFKYLKARRLQASIIILFSSISAVSGGLSIGLIIPILGGSTRPIFQDTPFDFLDNYLSFFSGDDFNSRIRSTAILIIILSSIELTLNIICAIIAARIELDVTKKLSIQVINKIRNLEFKTFFGQTSGSYFTYLKTDIIAVGDVVSKFLVTLQPLVLLIIYLFVMATVSPYLTVASIFFFILISILITGILGRRLKSTQKKLSELLVLLNSELNETFDNFKNLSSSGILNNQLERVQNKHADFLEARYDYQKNISIGLPINNFINSFAIAMLIILGAYIFRSQDESWTILLIPFLVLLFKILPTIAQVNNMRNRVESNYMYNDRLQKFLNLRERSTIDEIEEFNKLEDSIQFQNIDFSYSEKNKTLENISFTLKKNTLTALLGESGSGKSTIVDLLLKIYQPESGKIYFDDKNLSTLRTDSLRNNISYVSQDALFFNRSVEENLKIFNEKLDNKYIMDSLTTLNLESLKDDLDNILGQGGINLSSGQKQKLNFIRSYLKPSQLLILDEPTSNLDFESEDVLKNYITEIKSTQTILLITHSKRLLELADEIIVLDNGKVVENGTADAILNNNEYLSRMIES